MFKACLVDILWNRSRVKDATTFDSQQSLDNVLLLGPSPGEKARVVVFHLPIDDVNDGFSQLGQLHLQKYPTMNPPQNKGNLRFGKSGHPLFDLLAVQPTGHGEQPLVRTMVLHGHAGRCKRERAVLSTLRRSQAFVMEP